MTALREALIRAGVIKPAAPKPPEKKVEEKPLAVKVKKKPLQRVKPKRFEYLPLAEKLAIRAKEKKPNRPICCPLCGEMVKHGHLLEHKAEKHGECAITPSPIRQTNPPKRPIFVRGGSPGLKNK